MELETEQQDEKENDKEVILGLQNVEQTYSSDKILRMMEKMGYKFGIGLGKYEQGITKPVELPTQIGKSGLGMKFQSWDFYQDDVVVIEDEVTWFENQNDVEYSFEDLKSHIKEGSSKLFIDDECNFCDKEILNEIINGKEIFNKYDPNLIYNARTRSNPFETIRSAFFMNRAALKLANLDAVTNFMFTNIDQNIYHKTENNLYYFADVCAGPGGFTEYVLWRKNWRFKGFGFTLKGEHDFKLRQSCCAQHLSFQAFYGSKGDGNACCPDNIADFREKVMFETENKGVHFMTSDGGFSVEGQENLQEVLSKQLYVCQCLIALEVVRVHGHFVTKLFDLFTPFSVGLIFLMSKCFKKVSIIKPNSSRPANAERYFICYDLQKNPTVAAIKNYLSYIVDRLWDLKDDNKTDILEIFPTEEIKLDKDFFSYILNSNNRIGTCQIKALKKLDEYCVNTNLLDLRQEDIRKKCLECWQVPDLKKSHFIDYKIIEPVAEWHFVPPRTLSCLKNLEKTFSDLENWHYCFLQSTKDGNTSSFYAGLTASGTYRLKHNKWVKVKNVSLIKGTLLYGEMVKEKIQLKTPTDKSCIRFSLHAIDALFLGDSCIKHLHFTDRLIMLESYCKSVSQEYLANKARVRLKIIKPLKTLLANGIPLSIEEDASYSLLPILGINSVHESYTVNSMLILKTHSALSFDSTYVLRVQVPLQDTKEQSAFAFQDLLNSIA